jgi:hypothetical protein
MTSEKDSEVEPRLRKLIKAVWDAFEANEADGDEFFAVSLTVVLEVIEQVEDAEERWDMARVAYEMIKEAAGSVPRDAVKRALEKRKANDEFAPSLPPDRRTTPRWR